MGLNHVLVKLSAFTLGASTAGWPACSLPRTASSTPRRSPLRVGADSRHRRAGGMGSTVGVVIAAFVLTVAPELLRSFSEYRVLLFGVLMVLMMIWRPRG